MQHQAVCALDWQYRGGLHGRELVLGATKRRLFRNEQLELLNRVAAGEDIKEIAVLMRCSSEAVQPAGFTCWLPKQP